MYKASIRALLRHSIKKLNGGDYSLMLKMADPDFELAFPGENSWATMFRPPQRGRQRHVTHRGLDEAAAFADRVVGEGIQFQIEDILVNGPPWNTRIALTVHDFIPGDDEAADVYNNGRCSFSNSAGGVCSGGRTTKNERVAAWERNRAPRRERQRP